MINPSQILTAVKKDNIKVFDEIVTADKINLALCYGRFPLLSLCYLYKSHKIVKYYQKKLNDVSVYTVCDEPLDIYTKFKKMAKRSLRLYVFATDKIISPPEMLAVMGDSFYLEKKYADFKKSQKIKENITKIYDNNNISVAFEANKISIPKPLTFFQKRILPVILTVSLLLAVIPLFVLANLNSVYGLGTKGSPTKISSAEQLMQITNQQNEYFALTNDIDISGNPIMQNLSANIDGKGHTVYLNSSSAMIDELQGSIKNINFVINRNINSQISNDRSYVINKNSGIIENVSLTIAGSINVVASKSTNISCLVLTNNGEINNCTVDAKINITGQIQADTAFSLFANINNGRINNCVSAVNSYIVANTVDIAAIAYNNSNTGIIDRCVNNANIFQCTANSTWNPIVAGIVIYNLGTVSNCINKGNLTANCTSMDTPLTTQIIIGGIAAFNDKLISKCFNSGNINVNTTNSTVFCGGIVGVSGNYSSSIIDNCGSKGRLTINSSITNETTEDTTVVRMYGGGIVGYNVGATKNSFSYMTFISDNIECFFGGIMGRGFYVLSGVSIMTQNENNAFVIQENAKISVAIMEYSSILAFGQNENATVVNTLQELILLTIYWEIK